MSRGKALPKEGRDKRMSGTVEKPVFFRDRAIWRGWLKKNHSKAREVWILTYKVHTGRKCLSYQEALEEALCWGWIDSRMRTIDREKHLWRFAPRRATSIWSLINRTKAERLIAEGRMTPHGMAKIEEAKKSGEWDKATRPSRPPRMPRDLKEALMKDCKAWKNFQALARSYRTQFIWWVCTARREETRQRRIAEVVARARQNKKSYLG